MASRPGAAASAKYWDEVYSADNARGQVYRRRQGTILRWIDQVARPGALIADLGSGAGHLAVALARRAFVVVAVDRSEAMLERTVANASAAGVGHLVSPVLSDAHGLPFADEMFDIVVANGLLPWLEEPQVAIEEIVRVATPGGHVVLTMDNPYGIARFLDPGWHRGGRSMIRVIRSLLRMHAEPPGDPWPAGRSWKDFAAMLVSENLSLLERCSIGFGPFTFLGRPPLPRSFGMSLDHRLQRLSRGWRPLRNGGIFHLVLAQKPHGDAVSSSSVEVANG
jgi:ubiquinone/menaquinone biosynthesis C-methylase UbiE